MAERRYRIPSTSALKAFEAAARHCNFSRAARELHTSQSAISRHIANLEASLETSLFNRLRQRRLVLTPQGEQFYRAVVAGLDNIQNCIDAISGARADDQLTIACTHENSHLFLLPRFDALQRALGADKTIRVMTYEYEAMEEPLDPAIDIVFRYQPGRADGEDSALILREAVIPVSGAEFLRRHRAVLRRGIEAWLELPFLELSRRNYGWATWEDWLGRNGGVDLKPRYQYFNNYVYLLDAAAAGKGLALGWRGLIERQLEAGALQAVGRAYTEFDRGIHAVLTEYGAGKALARRCLEWLAWSGAGP